MAGITKEGIMLATIIGVLKTAGAFLVTPQGAGVGLATVVVGYILRKLDNKWVKGLVIKPFHILAVAVGGLCYGAGTAITIFFGGKFKLTKPFWNKLVEPYVIDLIDNIINGTIDGIVEVVKAAQKGIISGLRSDNK